MESPAAISSRLQLLSTVNSVTLLHSVPPCSSCQSRVCRGWSAVVRSGVLWASSASISIVQYHIQVTVAVAHEHIEKAGRGRRDMGREVLHLTTLEDVSAVELVVARAHLDRPKVLALLELGAMWSADVAPLPPPAARRCESRMVHLRHATCGSAAVTEHCGAGVRFIPAWQLAEIEIAREAASAAGIPKVCVCACVPHAATTPTHRPSLVSPAFAGVS